MLGLRVIIFNVEEGFCAFVRSPNNYTLLIDCGMGEKFSPIEYILTYELEGITEYRGRKLTEFILSHPHEDHITDINRLENKLPPAMILRQKYDWEKIKEPGGEYEILDTYVRWQATYDQPVKEPPNWGMEIKTGLSLSPSEARKINENKFINNSSIPVMIKYKGWKFFFSGDLEKDGWLELLQREEFKDALRGTDFFITAHHGHSSGYCKEIFDVMGRPHFNVVSTHKKDQSVESAYSTPSCAKGVEYNDKTRYMFSTRHDGSIFINVTEEGKATFNLRKLLDNI